MLNVEKRPEPTALEAKISALKYVRERLDGASKILRVGRKRRKPLSAS